MDTIRLIKRRDIDLHKWDELVERTPGSLPYCLWWYLDAVAENWDALVMNDYEAAMPLPWFRKLGLKCLYQPHYCQQTGIFSEKTLAKKTLQQFLNEAAGQFSYTDINLSAVAAPVAGEFALKQKINLVLPLNNTYGQLAANYSEGHRRHIRKAFVNGLKLFEGTGAKRFHEFYLKNVDRKGEYFKKKHEKIFNSITNELLKRNKAKIFTVINKEELVLAAVLMIFHDKRMINIVNCSSEEGKSLGASRFLMDGIIQKYTPSENILDFEGSSVPGVARFYMGFGAKEEIFFNYRRTVFGL